MHSPKRTPRGAPTRWPTSNRNSSKSRRSRHPKELNELLHRYTDALDGDDGAERAERQYDNRYLNLSETLDGMWRLDGMLDPELGQIASNTLNAMMGPRPQGETRTVAQRRA